jgi:hypothetical protein
MSRPPHPPWFNHPNNIWWRIQAMKFIIMLFSPRSVFLPFRSKYLPQHFSQKLSVSVSPPKWETKFRTHTAYIIWLWYLNCGLIRSSSWRQAESQ